MQLLGAAHVGEHKGAAAKLRGQGVGAWAETMRVDEDNLAAPIFAGGAARLDQGAALWRAGGDAGFFQHRLGRRAGQADKVFPPLARFTPAGERRAGGKP
jgi:hypothetical protein